MGVALEEAPVQASRRLGLLRLGCWDSLEGFSGLEFRALGFKVRAYRRTPEEAVAGLT